MPTTNSPLIAITTNSTSLATGQTAVITFTLSAPSTNFTVSDVDVSGGILSNFQGSGTSYTALFTPGAGNMAVIGVVNNKFSDSTGSFNQDGSDANNVVVLGINATPVVDTTAPTIAIVSNKANLTGTETATISFTLSENSADFTQADVNVKGGTLSNFQGSGKNYTATFTPTAASAGSAPIVAVIGVVSNKFTDAAGNLNKDGADANNVTILPISYAAADTTPPTIIVGSNKTTLSNTQTATISFTLSEASTDFTLSDVTAIGGTLSNFQGSGVNYTATFTPSAGATSAAVVVSSDRFSDAAGNFNKDGAESNNAVSLTISNTPTDTTPPTIIVGSDKTTLSNTQTATISFTLSESSTDFALSDVTAIGGTLSNFQGSGVNYTATFTPNAGATSAAVVVSSDRFSDAAGNFNKDGAENNNAVSMTINSTPVDTTPPTIIVGTDKTTLSNTQTATISFTLSETSNDFTASDVTVIGGTLSNFQGTGVNYTATFTPNAGATSAAVVVSSDRFSDAAGNLNKDGAESNNAVSLTIDSAPVDNTPPTIIVGSDKTTLSNTQTAAISFTLSESSNDFNLSDVTVIGGTLSNFQGSGVNYTATFTPSAGATSAAVVVSSDRFSDAAGNFNKDGAENNNAVSLTINSTSVDTTPPTIIVGSDKTTLSNTQTAAISFTLSESSSDFSLSDVTVIGGTLSNFQGSGVNYTATFTPTAGATSAAVVVSSDRFSDAAGNLNKDGAESNNAVSLTINNTPVDTTPPTIIVGSDKTTLSNTQTAAISFTLSESSSDFNLSDVTVIGGTLSNFQGSGVNYTATFTPTSGATSAAIVVSSDRFSDAAGNFNKDGSETNNAVSLTIANTPLDTTPPTVIVTSDKTTVSGKQTAEISFTLSEASTDFTLADVTVIGGTLSNFQGSGVNYTANFTPLAGVTSAAVIVGSDTFRDAAGNLNKDGSEVNNAVSLTIPNTTVDTTEPTIIVTSDKSSLSGTQTAAISFTLSEASTDFTLADVTVIGGTLSNFSGSGVNYTATFTPSAGVTSAAVVVSSDRFSDAAGNLNKDGAETNNAVSLTIDSAPVDNTPPTIVVGSDKTTLSNTQTATISFTLSESSTDFTLGDVTAIGGTLSNFQGAGVNYTATFTPTAGATSAAVVVSSDRFSDAAGNFNKDGAESNNAVSLTINNTPTDTTPPTIIVGSDKTTLSGTQTAAISFTLSESSSDFTLSDVTVLGGTLTNFQGSGTSYTATFTPTAGATSAAVVVSSDRFSDAAGNLNKDGAETNNAVSLTIDSVPTDTTAPTIIVGSDKTTLSGTQTAAISFTLSESSTDFTLSDVTVIGGTLSNFQGSGTSYTATFTPAPGATSAAVVVSSDRFSDAAGNLNKDGADTNNAVSMMIGSATPADTTPPTIILATDKTSLNGSQTATISFTLSEASLDFTQNDVTAIGGTLSNFQGSGVNYTATFTPAAGVQSAAVVVSSDRFSDVAGNLNKDGADANNVVSMMIGSTTPADTTLPTIVVGSDKTTLSGTQTAAISFTLSESSTDFTLSDVTVIGGTLSNFQGSGTSYTATFTPSVGATSAAVVVSSDRFSDAAGNLNKDGAETNNAVSLTIDSAPTDTTAPTIIVGSDKTTLSGTQTAAISFTLSESSTDFTLSDVTVIGGTLSNFSGSGVNYTATFTPTAGATSAAVVVSSDRFSDAAGNLNKDGAETNNAVSLTINNTPVDSTPPTIVVGSDKTTLSGTQTAAISFTLSEPSNDFTLSDVTVIGGTLSNFSGSGVNYTATFTPTAGATSAAVVVSSDRFSDAAGNLNKDGAETNNAVSLTIANSPVDTAPPTIIVGSDKTTLSGTQTAAISFTLSEPSNDFTLSDVTVIGGTLSNFSGSGVNYTATFTPTAGATSAAVVVSSDRFSDAAGNLNKDGAETNNAVSLTIDSAPTDTTAPTIIVGSDKTTLSGTQTAAISFTLSESSTDFTLSDLTVIGGTLSNFQGNGTSYTATFTPTAGTTSAAVVVSSDRFSDAAGNLNKDGAETNNAVSLTINNTPVDSTPPTIIVSSDKTTLSGTQTAAISFTLSESSTDFTLSDVTVIGGTLSNFSGSGVNYTATFTPQAGATSAAVVVSSDRFSDAAGNLNKDGAETNNAVSLTIDSAPTDTTAPTIIVGSDKTTLSGTQTAAISFTLSESSNDFTLSDVTVIGGTLSNFSGSGVNYTATFTPTAGTTSAAVVVSSDRFSDAAGNLNKDGAETNNAVSLTINNTPVDSTPPTVIVGSDKTTLSATQTAAISFTLSESSNDFTLSDVTVVGGVLSNFQGSGVSYTATFTPSAGATSAAVVVGSDRFSDAAGNLNKDGAETNNAVSLTIDTLPSDTTLPTIVVASDKTTLSATQTAAISFTLSESSSDFTLSDVTVIGGTLSNFQGSGTSYTATFTPAAGATSSAVVVSSDRFSDAAGNLNKDGAETNNAVSLTIDTPPADTTLPTIVVGSDKTTLSGTQTAAISFTLSESSTDFTLSDVTVIGGTLTNFQGSGVSYTAIFTPSADATSAAVVVSSDRFSDAAGNLNNDGAETNNAVSLTIDNTPADTTSPTVIVSSDKTTLSGTQTAAVSFTLSEASTDFALSDVTVIGGTLSNFQGSGTSYTATFTPTAGATSAAIVVSSDKFSDAAGNLNKDGGETNNAVSLTINNTPVDSTPPTVVVGSDKTTLSGTQTAAISFTLSEASTDFALSDVTVIGGTLSNFSGSGVNYTATFTPSAGVTSAAVVVSSDRFSDAAGNLNKDGAETNNAVSLTVDSTPADTTLPTIVVGSDKTTLSATQTAAISFTLSESSNDFSLSDVTVVGGVLSNFQGSGVNYTATFTPSAGATSAAVVVGSDRFSDAAGNLNKDGAETNNAVSLTVDSTPADTTLPTIVVASDKTTLSATQTAAISFTLSESSSDFTLSDVTVIGGTLSNFQGSGTSYTATFTPAAGATSSAVVVSSDRFSDAAGNLNKDGAETNNAVSLTIDTPPADTTLPTIVVGSDKTTLSGTQTAAISFTLSESSTDFTLSDVTVIGGTLTNFQGSGVSYTAIFTPSADATSAAVVVSSDRFSDAAGNLNNDGAETNNAVSLTIDNTPADTTSPTVIVSSDKTTLSDTQTASISFTLSEASSDFTLSDVNAIGGTLSNFQGSGVNYTATFTPSAGATSAAVVVSSDKFSDAAGNLNKDGAETNNAVSLTINNTPVDTTPPTVVVGSDKTTLSGTQTAAISFTLSESSNDFMLSDVTVIGGTLSNFSGSGVNYTATFTPTAGVTSAAVVVSSDRFSDAAGNLNKDGAETNNAVSLTVDSTPADTTLPTIVVGSDKTTLSATQTAAISFTLSESSNDFSLSDVTVVGGVLSNFQGSGVNYTATFTPSAGATSAAVVVGSDRFSDAAGNLNKDGAETNNAVSLTIDTLPSDTTLPTIVVASDKTTLSATQTAAISFTLSEASNDFTLSDVTVIGGTLSNFQGSGTSYTAIFTPSAGATSAALVVSSDRFSDAAGNLNKDGAETDNAVSLTIESLATDTTSPTITLGADKTTLSGTETAVISFTLSEASTDFTLADVTLIGGSLSNLQGSGTDYTATFTPTAGVTSAAVVVGSNRFSDAAGNFNKDGAEENNAVSLTINSTSIDTAPPVDNTPPTIVVSSDKTTLGTTQTATINFTLSEVSTDFSAADVTVIGGSLSNFQGSGLNYTAIFSPTAGATSAAVMVSSDTFRDAASNLNQDGAESNNAVSLTINNTPTDTTPPTILVATDKTTLSSTQTAAVSFTLSEASTDFSLSDVTVIGGTLSNFSGSGVNYTATFTPFADSTSAAVVVSSDRFSDAAGNFNKDGAESNNAVSLTINNTPVDTTPPTIIVGSDKTTLSNTQTAAVSFTLSEASTDFALNDVTVIGGTLSNFSGSGVNYTATFTPTAGATSAAIVVSSDKFSDAAGNLNKDGAESNNAVSLTINSTSIDTTPPTIAISSNKESLSTGESALITFTLSESSNDFTVGDVDLVGGALSNFQGSGTSYSATFTPWEDATDGFVYVDSDTFSDASGNLNDDGNDDNNILMMPVVATSIQMASLFSFMPVEDPAPPVPVITDDTTGIAANAQTVKFNFDFNKDVIGFDINDITVANGTKGEFQAISASQYSLQVTMPTGSAPSTGTAVVGVLDGSYTDMNAQSGSAAHGTQLFSGNGEGLIQGPVVQSNKLQAVIGQLPNGQTGEFYPAASHGLYYTVLADQGAAISDIPVATAPDSHWQIQSYLDAVRMQDGRVALIWEGVDTITPQASWGYQIMAADGSSTEAPVALSDTLGAHTGALSLTALQGGGFAIDHAQANGTVNHAVFTTAQTDLIRLGTSASNTLIGGDGDDQLIAGGGADMVYAGAGNDVVSIDLSNNAYLMNTNARTRIDGGSGDNQLRLLGAMETTLDLTNPLIGDRLGHFSNFDITGQVSDANTTLANSLQLNVSDVLQYGKSDGWGGHAVQIDGDANDTVMLSNLLDDGSQSGQWDLLGTVDQSGRTYSQYSFSTNQSLQVFIDEQIAPQLI